MARRPRSKDRLDVQALLAVAGEKVFARGQAYHKDGQVEIVSIDGGVVAARVRGTQLYRTRLETQGGQLSGECSCPAFDDFGFCKHLVATGLAANALDTDASKAIAGRTAKLREHLLAQGAEALADKLLAIADRDPLLRQAMELDVIAAGDDDNAILARLSGAIADAVSIQDHVVRGEAGALGGRMFGRAGTH
jgi:uncharacterized Zn finger protein